MQILQSFNLSPSTQCTIWLVDTANVQLFSRENVYESTNGCNMAVKQIQTGLSGLHLISRMLKVRLKQICGRLSEENTKSNRWNCSQPLSHAWLLFFCMYSIELKKISNKNLRQNANFSCKKDSAKKAYAHFKQQFCSTRPSQFTVNALSYLMLQIPRAGTLELSNHTRWHTVWALHTNTNTRIQSHTPHIQSEKDNEFNTAAITVN